MSNIHKIWGERRRILLTETSEIDLLYLKKDSFCSLHKHKNKINRFVVIEGLVRIETEYGYKILKPNESFEVEPLLKHRFVAKVDSVMIELAYVKRGKIDPNDIDRKSQGGRIINTEYVSLIDLRKRGLLDL